MLRLVAVSLLVHVACGGATRPTAPDGPAPIDPAALTIPVGPGAGEALTALDRAARTGDVDAAWIRLHYLLDLFDDARFRGDDASRQALAGALGLDPDARGPAATDAAIAALTAEADRILDPERLHPGARAARTLLELDAAPPRARSELYQRAIALGTVAGGGGEVAANAVLRSVGQCRRALEDSLSAPAAEQPRLLAHCLYPLYDADPAPYFAPDPADRPPPPAWRELVADADALAARIPADDRLEAAARAQRDWLAGFAARADSELAEPPDPIALRLPAVAGARPYDAAPLAHLDAQSPADAAALAGELEVPVAGDGRGAVAVALAAHAPARHLLPAAEAAVRAGADELRVLVATEQRLAVPPGDYWSGRLRGDRVARAGVVPLSLVPLGANPNASPRRGAPRASDWDPSRADLGLHLAVGVEAWRLVAAGGEVARIDSATTDRDPRAALRRALLRVRAAFPDEDGLVLVPVGDATHAALVAAATAAARDEGGAPLFSRLAIAAAAPKPGRRGALATRIARRAPAAVEIEPALLASRAAVARRCYQDLLERRPKLAGAVRLEREGGEVRVVGAPPGPLAACAERAVAAALAAGEADSAVLRFAVDAAP